MKGSGCFAVPAGNNGRAVALGALAVPAAALLTAPAPMLGPLTWHMGLHIASMNVAAPLAAVLLGRSVAAVPIGRWPAALWCATLIQLAVLWVSHSPPVHNGAHASAAAAIALHAVLFGVALAFWLSIVQATAHRWQAMLALLVSGKLACLLGALLIFAPRALLEGHGPDHTLSASLSDQHLAGLLMIAACPLSYVLPAVVLATSAIGGLEASDSDAIPGKAVGQTAR